MTSSTGTSSGAYVYQGWYICQQGRTNLKLTLNENSPDRLDAVFAFEAPDGKSGSFKMQGNYINNRTKIILRAGEWISRPSGYGTVDVSGSVSSDRNTISGTIDTPGCSTFNVAKFHSQQDSSSLVQQDTKPTDAQNKLWLEKIVVAKNGTCKIFIPINVIRDSIPNMLKDSSLVKCDGGDRALSEAIVKPSMKWSGSCGSDGYAYGESGKLTASYVFPAKVRGHGTNNYSSDSWNGTTEITGTVEKGHYQGKMAWSIRAQMRGDSFYSCGHSDGNFYVSKGQRFSSQQDYDEFVNPELKKARLALEKKNRDEAEQRQRAYEEEQRKREREFVSLLNSKDPQAMYLAAGKYARDGNSDKAKQIYEAITNRFPSSPFAIKASDQLTAMDRTSRTESATRDADSNARQRAYNACKIEVNSCYSRTNGKGNCYRDCDSLR